MPPWLADDSGLLDGVQRTTAEGWEVIGGGTAGLFSKGQASVNLVAAVPSLHAGFSALVAMFLWGRVRPALRPVVALYPLAMGLTLIATGEHYFFDIVLGYLYAGAVMAAWAWWERRREATAPASALRRVEVGDRALGHLGGEADRLGEGRVRVDREAEVLGVGAHLDRQRHLGDQLAGVDADDPDAEDAPRRGIDEELGQPVGAGAGERPA